ncbi:MAG: type II toxin-antitoxin system PemK/MazF family toxin [Dehalococcoidia bacterium]
MFASITSRPRGRLYPFHVPLTAQESGLRLDGMILCEQLQTMDQRLLGNLIGMLPLERMGEVDAALCWSLGIEQ